MACNCKSSFLITATNALLFRACLAFLAGCRKRARALFLLRISDKAAMYKARRTATTSAPDGPIAPLAAAVTGPGSQAHQRGQTLAVTFA